MALSNRNEVGSIVEKGKGLPTEAQVLCRLRKEWVVATPEEKVRQRLIQAMIQELHYPEALLVVEKSLQQMPHLAMTQEALPLRRADLVCFAKGIHPSYPLYPLLLVECKAVPLNRKVVSQVTGYNQFLKAHYVAVVNDREIRTGWYDAAMGEYRFTDTLPSFTDLLGGDSPIGEKELNLTV